MTAVGMLAQTAVTTSGGNNNQIPLFTGSSAVGNSIITQSGAKIGIGTSAPTSTLDVSDGTSLGGANPYELRVADGTGSSALRVGQAAGSDAFFAWIYNATATSAYGLIGTAQAVNPLVFQGFGGKVGIGTTTPGSTLEVNGNVTLTANSGGSMTYPDGTVQSTAWNGVLTGGDYAESVAVLGSREKYEPGDVLVIDPSSEGIFLRSSVPYSTAVTGVYSTKPGLIGRRQLTTRAHMKEEVPMAMTGIVPTKVTVENGSIKPGDLLVTSSRPGYAMKGTDRGQMLGAVIGKAIGRLDSGAGIIEAVVTLQ